MSGRLPLAASQGFSRSIGIRLQAALAATAALFLLIPAGFASDSVTPAGEKSAKAPSLAETGPKPNPVPKADPKQIEASIRRGVAFLLKRQNANGSWGSERSSRPSEVYAPIPGAHQSFRGAVTSLCISALLEVGGDSPEVSAVRRSGRSLAHGARAQDSPRFARCSVQQLVPRLFDRSLAAHAAAASWGSRALPQDPCPDRPADRPVRALRVHRRRLVLL